jgi:hypothetical protein
VDRAGSNPPCASTLCKDLGKLRSPFRAQATPLRWNCRSKKARSPFQLHCSVDYCGLSRVPEGRLGTKVASVLKKLPELAD